MKRVPEPILLNDRKKRRPLAQGGGGGGGESEVRLESERQGVWKAKGKGGQGGGGGAGESEVRILRGTQLNKFLILLNPEVAQLNNFLILSASARFWRRALVTRRMASLAAIGLPILLAAVCTIPSSASGSNGPSITFIVQTHS